MNRLKLIPIHGHGEHLDGVSRRPALELSQNASLSLHLGRNSTTKISDARVHKRLARVTFENSRAYLVVKRESRGLEIEGRVGVLRKDSRIELQDQDRLFLLKNKYAYTVCISDGSTTEQVTSTPTAAAVASLNSTQKESPFIESMADEVMCAVCMDILVNATTLVPCGHRYCHACRRKLLECPTCRARITTSISDKQYDNMIWNMVQESAASGDSTQFFCADDIQSYLTRSKRTLTVAAKKRATPMTSVPRRLASPRSVRRRVVTNETASSSNNAATGNSLDEAICID